MLDLAVVPDGATSASALAATTTLARRAEELGFDRFWVAEHHNMPTIASTSPPVLMAHLAATTTRIRIGSGGVMLPNHPALVVAEQFALLEALHPGRIDLGIGRAREPTRPPPPPCAAPPPASLSTTSHASSSISWACSAIAAVTMVPGTVSGRRRQLTTTPQVVVLGSSAYSAQLAGLLGLPYAFAHRFDVGTAVSTLDAVALYRESFRPSAVLDAPYTIVTVGVLAADTSHAPSSSLLPPASPCSLCEQGDVCACCRRRRPPTIPISTWRRRCRRTASSVTPIS